MTIANLVEELKAIHADTDAATFETGMSSARQLPDDGQQALATLLGKPAGAG